MAKLFEPGGSFYGTANNKMKFTEAQRLRATLAAKKATVLRSENLEVNIDDATLTAEGSSYLLPVDFVENLRAGKIKRQSAVPQQPLEHIDGPLEDKALNWDHDTKPIYWLHVPEQGTMVVYPVYGYAADYGMGYHVTPFLSCRPTEAPGWKDAEWLCRCAQCGRELPPSYFYMNTSGRLKGICKACTSTNHLVDKIFKKPMRYRSDDELQLLVDTRHWYEALWRRNLCPRGDYAGWCIGEADIKERMRIATKHKRGSAPRQPNTINPSKLKRIYALMENTQEYV